MILLVSDGIHRLAGTERVICNLAHSISGEFKVKIYVPGNTHCAFCNGPIEHIETFKIGDFPRRGVFAKFKHRAKYFKNLLSCISQHDTLVGFSFDMNVLCIIAARIKGARAVCCEHIHYNYHNALRRYFRKLFYRSSVASVVVLTESDRLAFAKIGVDCTVIPNFIDYNSSALYCRERHEKKTILFVGRLSEQKNVVFLLEAFEKSGVWEHGWKLNIVGEGEQKNSLLEWLSKSMIASQVAILPASKEVFRHYDNASVFCMTSRFEAFPMVLLEAMNSKLPVITTDCPTGPREIIGSVDLGQIVPIDDIEAFANALREACSSFELCNIRAESNHARVASFDRKMVLDQWKRILKRENHPNPDDQSSHII